MTRSRAKSQVNKEAQDYLRAPYARILLPERDGGYVAEILEFPGCIAEGDTAEEALRNLEQAATAWIAAAIGQGQHIPEPMDVGAFGGRVALRLPRSLHRQAARLAERDGTSLNQFVVSAIASRVGADDVIGRLAEKWSRSQTNVVRTEPLVQTVSIISISRAQNVLLSAGDIAISGKWDAAETVPAQLWEGVPHGR